jgi:hypothetical protein
MDPDPRHLGMAPGSRSWILDTDPQQCFSPCKTRSFTNNLIAGNRLLSLMYPTDSSFHLKCNKRFPTVRPLPNESSNKLHNIMLQMTAPVTLAIVRSTLDPSLMRRNSLKRKSTLSMPWQTILEMFPYIIRRRSSPIFRNTSCNSIYFIKCYKSF